MGHYDEFYWAAERANLIQAHGPKSIPKGDLTREYEYQFARAAMFEKKYDDLVHATRVLVSAARPL